MLAMIIFIYLYGISCRSLPQELDMLLHVSAASAHHEVKLEMEALLQGRLSVLMLGD